MTIRDRIVALLVAEPCLTNRQIAEKLSVPEPSVRRTTNYLELDSVINAEFKTSSPLIHWSMKAENSDSLASQFAGR